MLQGLDPCKIRKYTKLQGHSLACLSRKMYQSTFTHLRILAVHHSEVQTLVRRLYYVNTPTVCLSEMNTALHGTVADTPTLL